MRKINSFIKKNYKLVFAFVLGGLVFGSFVYAETIFKSSDVEYDNKTSGLTSTNMQGAIDELNTKATTKIAEAKAECPEGYICNYGSGAKVQTKNSNILAVYTYNPKTCVTGEESTCRQSSCANYSNVGSCGAGTIIKYKVNASTTKYFHVIHDDGKTMTLQQRENTTDNVAWNSNTDNTKGPTTALAKLESATSGWSNVNNQTYTMGSTNFNNTNSYTGCGPNLSCTTNAYTLGSRTAKARMITMQEAIALGCTNTTKSCPNWMNNYLYKSTSYGGTVNVSKTFGYWTMSAHSSKSTYAWLAYFEGRAASNSAVSNTYGARAVVVIPK